MLLVRELLAKPLRSIVRPGLLSSIDLVHKRLPAKGRILFQLLCKLLVLLAFQALLHTLTLQ